MHYQPASTRPAIVIKHKLSRKALSSETMVCGRPPVCRRSIPSLAPQVLPVQPLRRHKRLRIAANWHIAPLALHRDPPGLATQRDSHSHRLIPTPRITRARRNTKGCLRCRLCCTPSARLWTERTATAHLQPGARASVLHGHAPWGTPALHPCTGQTVPSTARSCAPSPAACCPRARQFRTHRRR